MGTLRDKLDAFEVLYRSGIKTLGTPKLNKFQTLLTANGANIADHQMTIGEVDYKVVRT